MNYRLIGSLILALTLCTTNVVCAIRCDEHKKTAASKGANESASATATVTSDVKGSCATSQKSVSGCCASKATKAVQKTTSTPVIHAGMSNMDSKASCCSKKMAKPSSVTETHGTVKAEVSETETPGK